MRQPEFEPPIWFIPALLAFGVFYAWVGLRAINRREKWAIGIAGTITGFLAISAMFMCVTGAWVFGRMVLNGK